jgi:rfaE bifunctional protein kinase chain/domain
VNDFSKRRVTVIGDVMLDRYIRGSCTRVSPEAPVPVVCVSDAEATLGGAANVAANCVSLGAQALLIGAVGSGPEPDGDALSIEAAQQGIYTMLFGIADKTTVKTRVIANDQQVVRYDNDGRVTHTVPLEWGGDSFVRAFVRDCDAIVLSDYGKGMVTPAVVRAAVMTKRPVFVDPKDGGWEKYQGAFCIKPNEYELEKHLKYMPADEELGGAFRHIADTYGFQCILLTRGARGMVLWRRGWNAPVMIGAVSQEVFDLSGAGDTAIAAFAVAQDLGLLGAAQLANRAAGLVVGKRGTSVITKEELT